LPSLFAGHDTSWIEAKLHNVDPELANPATDCRLSKQTATMATYAAKSVRDGFKTGMPPTQIGRLAEALPNYDPDFSPGEHRW
jgi:hypothetical protein